MKGSVLVVEDNPVTRKMLRVALTVDGFRVSEVERGDEALRCIERDTPDLVLSDLLLPDMDGFELLRRIRALGSKGALPVVAVSGFSDEGRVRAAGFSDHLMKPTEPSRVVEAVRLNIRPRSSQMKVTGRHLLLVDDDPVQLKVQCLQLRNAGFQVVVAGGGAEAFEMAKALRPIAIVSDVVMPVMDGFRLCAAVRATDELSRIPVVLTSSQFLDRRDRDMAVQAGATAFIPRTPDSQEVITALRRLPEAPRATPDLRAVLPVEPHRQMIARLEHQAAVSAQLARSNRLWRSLSMLLSQLADVAPHPRELDHVLGSVLSTFLDACGFSMGAAYLCSDGELDLSAHLGFREAVAANLEGFFGSPHTLSHVLDAGEPLLVTRSTASDEWFDVLEASTAKSMLVRPLTLGGVQLGVLVLGSMNDDIPTDWLELSHMAVAPIAQSIALARAVAKLASSEQRFRGIAESTGDGLVVGDGEGKVEYLNPAAAELLGRGVDAIGSPISDLLPFLEPGGPETQQGRVSLLVRGEVLLEVCERLLEGQGDETRRIYAIRDLSERHRAAEFAHLANHDSLTGLFNRRRFDEELSNRLAECDRYGTAGALLLIDVDRFKSVNDTLGHAAGDTVLRAIGVALSEVTRTTDFCARFGGDEFAVLLPHATAAQALVCAEKIRARLAAAPVEFAGSTIPIETSIGVAAFPDRGICPADLFEAADRALYRAKRYGRNRAYLAGQTPNSIPVQSIRNSVSVAGTEAPR